MKLRTMMQRRLDGVCMPWCDPNKPVFECYNHDAMVAHAMIRAMNEIEGTYADCSTAEDVRTFLHERADELMREWTEGVG